MKKKSFLLVILITSLGILFIPNQVYSQINLPECTLTKPLDIEQSGKIKFREAWLYKVKDGMMSPQGIKIGYERFDLMGRKVEQAKYDESGKTLFEVTYTFDNWGRELQCVGLMNEENFFRKWQYISLDSLNLLEKHVYHISTNKQKWLYYFDDKGNVKEEVNYNADGEFNYRYRIIYNNFGKISELSEYNGDSSLYEKWVYVYNNKNQNIGIMQFESNGEMFRKYIKKYNENGVISEVYALDPEDHELQRVVYLYQYF